MKNINVLFGIVGLAVLFSCENILEQKNPNELDTTQFWKTEEDLSAGLNATYRALRFNGEYRRWLHILYVSRSDEGYSSSPNPTFVSYSNFLTENSGSAEAVLYTWLDLYKGIFWANQVLDNAPNIDMNNEARSRIVGQAYFLRGIGYFNLAGVYGRGPVYTSAFAETTSDIYEQPDIYRQAQKDFEEAAKRLPAQWENPDVNLGRVTQGGALGMGVKVAAQLHEWDKVKTLCETIFSLKNGSGQPLYSLMPDYRDNFTEANENNAESLFEVQFVSGPVNGVGQLSQERAKFLGLPANGCSYDDATAGNIVKTDLEKEKTSDGKTDPRLKHTLFYYDASAFPSEIFYGKTWTAWGLNREKVYWKKYTCWDTKTAESHEDNGINFRVVRLADIYLMYAEALNELGRPADAYEYINRVRARAGLPPLEASTVFTGIGNDYAKMRAQIIHERSCELAGESWRWFDLERWGMFDTAENISWLKSRDSEFGNFVIGQSNRFPIPYREIHLVLGLEQNPGYK
ncbi:MAG: RagB/SusD family nutrient uptake outer membrane protein [Dysgonamonadaceae bacterium]|jgi:tetratricopeptide (TPR) repeat protein|nr:RagB/SusD family nutrient uptake outer membrane protein [Dysgonamonadaceae bacterium]